MHAHSLCCSAVRGEELLDLRPPRGPLGVRTGGADGPGRSCIYWERLCTRQLTHIISNPHHDLAGDKQSSPKNDKQDT